MKKKRYLVFLSVNLIICFLLASFIFPIFPAKAYSQYSSELYIQQNKLRLEMEVIKAEMIDLIGEMLNMIVKDLEELTINFNDYFKLNEQVQETATSTATTTEDTIATSTEQIEESTSYQQSYQPSSSASSCYDCPMYASGAQTYKVSTSNIPTITQVIVDPFDMTCFATQTVTVKITDSNENPITSVEGMVSTDAVIIPFTFAFQDGEADNGTWQGSWVLTDSICYNFMLTITAKSASGSSKVDLTFR